MYQLVFHPEALKEYNKAIIWYETQQEYLGDRFTRIIDAVIGRIQRQPEHFGFGKRPYREASVPVFPFTIVYKVNKVKHIIYIVSIYHTSRNPRFKFRKI
jgi:mRNA-degrading endonuclease RelE of RelBE toxin-antitoxin system